MADGIAEDGRTPLTNLLRGIGRGIRDVGESAAETLVEIGDPGFFARQQRQQQKQESQRLIQESRLQQIQRRELELQGVRSQNIQRRIDSAGQASKNIFGTILSSRLQTFPLSLLHHLLTFPILAFAFFFHMLSHNCKIILGRIMPLIFSLHLSFY